MQFEPFEQQDLIGLNIFSPPGWGDLVPRFVHFLSAPFCHPIKLTEQEKTVAIGTSILHGDTAWLACIIVHPDHRNKGYGKWMTQQLIDNVPSSYKTIYLDATDMGYPVYTKLGFEVEILYAHLKPEKSLPTPPPSPLLIAYDEQYHEQLLQLDQSISGEDRSPTLIPHINSSQLYISGNKLEGFYLPTLDDGLIIACTEKAGLELVHSRLRDKAYAVLPVANKPAIAFLQQQELVQFRTSRRMRLGKPRKVQFENIYNRISGQLG